MLLRYVVHPLGRLPCECGDLLSGEDAPDSVGTLAAVSVLEDFEEGLAFLCRHPLVAFQGKVDHFDGVRAGHGHSPMNRSRLARRM